MKWAITLLAVWFCSIGLSAQESEVSKQELNDRIQKLENEVNELKQVVKQLQARTGEPAPTSEARAARASAMPANVAPSVSVVSAVPGTAATSPPQSSQTVISEDRKVLDFMHDTTLNLGLDTYYDYNFNDPVGRVNLLRAYDVLSNEFSLSQASVILEHTPDLNAGSRWGARLDLQFGQATDTSQGNPSNEPRPEVYRNIFQAYGTYIVPLGKGLNVDFGKWSSSLGIEGNYTKDQFNYSRSFWFNFLPLSST